jgi:hypothetical protein
MIDRHSARQSVRKLRRELFLAHAVDVTAEAPSLAAAPKLTP